MIMIFRPKSGVSAGKSAAFAALLASLAACSGKGVAGNCTDYPACGGDPSGTWQIQTECQFDVYQPATAPSPIASAYTVPQTPALATPAPSTALSSGEWCSGLVYLPATSADANQLAGVAFYPAPLEFHSGFVTFTPSDDPAQQLFQFTIAVKSKPQLTHFAPACLQAYGANPSCDDITAGLIAQGTSVNYQNASCATASDGGCDCSYNLADTNGDSGQWRLIGNTIYAFNSPSGHPAQAMDYCVNGNTMTLSGKDGSHLLGSAGIRTMTLTKCDSGACGDATGG